jgi:hypothetical protein
MGARIKRKLRLLAVIEVRKGSINYANPSMNWRFHPGLVLTTSLDQANVQCHNRDYALIVIDHSLCGCGNPDGEVFPILPGNAPSCSCYIRPTITQSAPEP